MSGTYYVYSLKDTSINPARPFYIAKGTGTRAGGPGWPNLLPIRYLFGRLGPSSVSKTLIFETTHQFYTSVVNFCSNGANLTANP